MPQSGHVLVVLQRHPFHGRTFHEQSGLQDVRWKSAFNGGDVEPGVGYSPDDSSLTAPHPPIRPCRC